MKLFYNTNLPFTRHVVNNWNAYTPKKILFHETSEIIEFCKKANLEIIQIIDEGNGVSLTAKKNG